MPAFAYLRITPDSITGEFEDVAKTVRKTAGARVSFLTISQLRSGRKKRLGQVQARV